MRRRLALGLAFALAAGCSKSAGGGTTSGFAGSDESDARVDTRDVGSHDEGGTADALGGPEARLTPDADEAPRLCDVDMPTITPQSTNVAGVLTGPSRNAIVTCQVSTSTPGPDAFFKLEVSAYTIVELTVSGPVQTILAIRTSCQNDTSDVACSETPPPSDFTTPNASPGGGTNSGPAAAEGGSGLSLDAGDAPPADGGDAASTAMISSVRAGLAAGTYLVVVDSPTLGDLSSAAFTLDARIVPATGNGSCEGATLLTPQSGSAVGNLDQAGPAEASCGGSERGALFYSVEVPANNRLTVRAMPEVAGDLAWMPTLAVFAACGATTCLAQAGGVPGEVQELEWVNNGSSSRLVTLSVGADAPMSGVKVIVQASVTDLLASCARPMPVQDGTFLLDQDPTTLSNTNQRCFRTDTQALYYAATLLPLQSVTPLRIIARNNTNLTAFHVAFRTACNDDCTLHGPDGTSSFINLSSTPQTVLIEISQSPGNVSKFDLGIAMPLPPAGIQVAPTVGLVTTEAGGIATFEVVLTSPPAPEVSIAVASDTPTEGQASPSMLYFHANDWSRPQTVTVTGVDDTISDGPRKYKILLAPATSADVSYMGLQADYVEATNLDDDPGLAIDGADDLVTSEDGATATFAIHLSTKPTDTVTVPLSSSNTAEGLVSPATLTFSSTNWNVPQVVTVTGVDDKITDGTQVFDIKPGPLVSNDLRYGGQTQNPIAVHNRDDDYQPVDSKVITGAAVCNSGAFSVATDELGMIYIVVSCNGQLDLLTSADGGATFSDPNPIPNTAGAVAVVLAAGPSGTAYVAFLAFGGAKFTHTTNGGQTWSPPRMLPGDGGLHVVAARDAVFVLMNSPISVDGAVLMRSEDRARSFLQPELLGAQMTWLAVQPDGKSVFVLDNSGNLLSSSDSGASFNAVGQIRAPGSCCYAVGTEFLYSFQNKQVATTGLTDPTKGGWFGGPEYPAAVAIDDTSDVAIIGLDTTGTETTLTRFLGDMTLTQPRVLGSQADSIAAVALSRNAVGVVFLRDSTIQFSVVTGL